MRAGSLPGKGILGHGFPRGTITGRVSSSDRRSISPASIPGAVQERREPRFVAPGSERGVATREGWVAETGLDDEYGGSMT